MYNPKSLFEGEGTPPPPLDCHPAYADKPWVRDWVSGKQPQYNTYQLHVPIRQSPRLEYVEADPSRPEVINRLTMQRHKAFGAAPYVGDPFVYVWWVGVDNLGRHVCSDSAIHYLPFEQQFF